MKKILLFFISILSVFCLAQLKIGAEENNVLDYNIDTYFRGVWVTPKDGGNIGNIKPTSTKTKEQKIEDYKLEVTRILDIMEWHNLNALIFHIRIDNDAIYYSSMNPWSSWFTVYGEDPGWDPLEWVIEETHKRGIEFHAWMNPYRITASGKKGVTAAQVASKIPSYNIGSNPDNLLVSSETYGTILNPGIPEVRTFIIDTCMEVIEKYDVDAIHFDDYFYISSVDDEREYQKYNPNNLKKDDWRREQVDLFIKELSEEMRAYNKEHNRFVQLGISPSGIWKSAGDSSYVKYDENGTAITNGSGTYSTFEHYGEYLYSDTKKWCDEEWIDYILPQTYWGISHPTAAFIPLIDWWDAIVKYKKVNLYSGMGIYMSATPGKNYSWGSDYQEAYKQIVHCYELENTLGTVYYNFTYLKDAYYGKTGSLYGMGLTKVKNELFNIPSVLPEIRTMERVSLPAVDNLKITMGDNNTISFDALDGAKFYVIYRSNDEIDYSSKQVYKIISNEAVSGKVTFVDENSNGNKYSYGIKALSGTNTLGEGSKIDSSFKVVFKEYDGTILKEEIVRYGQDATAPTPNGKEEAKFVGWSRDITNVTKDLEVIAKYDDSDFIVNFYDINGKIIKTEKLKYLENAKAPNTDVEGYTFIKWSQDFTNVKMDLDIYPIYEINSYKVNFKYIDPITNEEIVLSEQVVKYNESATLPKAPDFTGYTFEGWSENVESVKKDMDVFAKYEPIYFTVKFINSEDGSIIEERKVRYGEDTDYPTPPEVKGMKFSRWRGPVTNITSDRVIQAIYEIAEYRVVFKDWDGTIIKEIMTFYEEEIDVPQDPTRDGYTFIGWDKDFSEIISDLEITALYRKNLINVKYYDFDGNVIKEEDINNEGQEIIPNFEAPVVSGYEFDKWEKTITETDDIEFRAVYTKVIKKNNCKSMSIQSFLNIFSVLGIMIVLKKRKEA